MKNSESKYYNTALLMNEALLFLLEKKDYEFITIKEICEKAGVNRSTFYLHYESIDDLLLETVAMINKKFYESFDNEHLDVHKLDKDDLFLIDDEHIIPYLEFVKENKKLYKIIHKSDLFQTEEVTKKMYDDLFKIILDKYNVPDDEKEYTFAFFSFGLVAIIERWVKRDCIDDVEKLTHIMKKVIRDIK